MRKQIFICILAILIVSSAQAGVTVIELTLPSLARRITIMEHITTIIWLGHMFIAFTAHPLFRQQSPANGAIPLLVALPTMKCGWTA